MTPWSDPASPWKSQAAYFTWLRGMLRRAWTRHPLSIKFKNARCRPAMPADGFKKQVKQIGRCERCGNWFAKSKLEVDHIDPAGSLRDWEDVGPFVQRLLGCMSHTLRLVCKPCHDVITAAERFACSEEEAITKKEVIRFGKLPAADQKKELKKLGMPVGENTAERRSIYHQHLCTQKKTSRNSSNSTDG